MRKEGEYLFSKYDLHSGIETNERAMYQAIDQIEGDRLLNTNVEDWCNYFEQEFLIKPPRLIEDKITIDQKEAKIDVSADPSRVIFERDRPFYITGTEITFFVPFEGDKQLFYCQASSYTSMPPCAIVGENELLLIYSGAGLTSEQIKEKFNRDLSNVRKYLEWTSRDVTPFNSAIRSKAKARIESRRQKLLTDKGLVASLGFPLKRDTQSANTYVVPAVRKKVSVSMPTAGTAPFIPEPTIDMQKYEEILFILTNMVKVMERSPHAFKGMKEEDLRQHFLVQLNGQYEGQATGETFNFEGKTDILIRHKDKNIFIAECAFWEGEAYFTKKVNQLLDYTCWRDTKTAILIFNRNKDLTNVLSQIPAIVAKHPNFKRRIGEYKNETGFRFNLHHKDDKNRELTLTVLVFEVPV